jgi:hypothetical protein
MRRLLLAMALLIFANPIGAQERTTSPRNWSIYAATGWMASSGGGSETLMRERIPALFGLRFRLEEGKWWLGVELDAWTARATKAGRDSIIARTRSSFISNSSAARFNATTLSFLARRDIWTAGPFDAYVLASVGATMGGGYIPGRCGSNLQGYPTCSEPPITSRAPGMAIAGTGGVGMTARYSQLLSGIPRWASWVLGDRVMLEGKVNSQSATEGRFTSGIVHLGIAW